MPRRMTESRTWSLLREIEPRETQVKYKMTDFAAKHGMTLAKGRVYGVFEGYRVQVDYSPFGNPRCLISVAAHIAGKQ